MKFSNIHNLTMSSVPFTTLKFSLLLTLFPYLVHYTKSEHLSKHLNLFAKSSFTYFHYYDCSEQFAPVRLCNRKRKRNDSIQTFAQFDERNEIFQAVVTKMHKVFPGKYVLLMILDTWQSSHWTRHNISAYRTRFPEEPVHLVDDPWAIYFLRNNNEPKVPNSIWIVGGSELDYSDEELDKLLTTSRFPGVMFFKIGADLGNMSFYCHTCDQNGNYKWIEILAQTLHSSEDVHGFWKQLHSDLHGAFVDTNMAYFKNEKDHWFNSNPRDICRLYKPSVRINQFCKFLVIMRKLNFTLTTDRLHPFLKSGFFYEAIITQENLKELTTAGYTYLSHSG